jgi:hypothetical protein
MNYWLKPKLRESNLKQFGELCHVGYMNSAEMAKGLERVKVQITELRESFLRLTYTIDRIIEDIKHE